MGKRHHTRSPNDSWKLLSIVAVAATVRVFTLWVGRAEFTGWLNHTYYYFVQVRGLLDNGRLPYPDMPLLFWLDATLAGALGRLGMESGAAVVASTRLVMCLVPSLVAVPVFRMVRNLNRGEPLRGEQWGLVVLSAFLPLSLSHLPELLQKNLLGLLLLALVVLWSQRLLLHHRRRDVAIVTALALLVVLAHYGSSAALALYGLALFGAVVIAGRAPGRVATMALSLLVGGCLALALVHLLDAQRFGRVFLYAAGSVKGSLVAALGSREERTPEVWVSLAAVLGFYCLLYLLYRVYRRCRERLTSGEKVFWLASILFCGLLLLPLFDRQLAARLSLFAALPLLIVFAHVERHGMRRPAARRIAVGLLATVTAVLAVGELVSSKVHNRHHREVLAELRQLEVMVPFGPRDLVLARTGAEHVCNWFYRVKAGVVTSLELADFERYDHVYVLNPLDGQLPFDDVEGRSAESEADRYVFMRRNIPRPPGVEPLFTGGQIELFELEGPPPGWSFGSDGRFRGYTSDTEARPAREP